LLFSYQRSRCGTSTAVNGMRLFREQIDVRIRAVGDPAWPHNADVHVHGKSHAPPDYSQIPLHSVHASRRDLTGATTVREKARCRTVTAGRGDMVGSTVLESFSHPVVDHGTRVGHLGLWWRSQLWSRWDGAVRLDRRWSNYWSWWHPVRLPLFCRNPPSARKVNHPGKTGQHPFGSKRRSVRLGCLNDPRRRGFGR